jgi:hypothetical protein
MIDKMIIKWRYTRAMCAKTALECMKEADEEGVDALVAAAEAHIEMINSFIDDLMALKRG